MSVSRIRGRVALFATVLLTLVSLRSAPATETLRVGTYNVQAMNVGTGGFTALVNVLQRMNADVLMLQEIDGNTEATQVGQLASAAGYPYFFVGNAGSALSGGLRNAVLSRHPITGHVSWTSAAISGSGTANDISREIVQVEITVPAVCVPVAVFTVHLKSGFNTSDVFRRAVETFRLGKVVAAYAAAHPGAVIFVGGDVNEDIGDGPFGMSFNSLPSGLPSSFKLGPDVSFPVVYDIFTQVTAFGGLFFVPADATSEDCTTCYQTRAASGRRLDYLWTPFAAVRLGDEVYNSGVDNGIDDGPSGNFLYKAGTPPAAGTSGQASDHFPVFADYLLESCDGTRFGSAYPGSHVLTPRAGIKGTPVVGDGGFGLRLRYARPLTTTVLVFGQSKLLPPFGFPLAPYVPGASLHVDVASAYGLFTLGTNGQGNAEFPLPLPPVPAYAGLHFDAQWFVLDAGAANGIGAMTDAYEVILQ